MIIVRFIGGLGNQMFQYAFYRRLKEQYKLVKADITGFKKYTLHNGYELERVFNIKADFATIDEIESVMELYKKNILDRLKRKVFGIRKTHITESRYKEDYLKKGNLYLDGYWQGEKYFITCEKIVRNDFQFRSDLSDKNRAMISNIATTNSISVHVRRGDYLNLPMYFKCDSNYYKRAVDIIKERATNPYYFIFSDDISWVKCNIDFGKQAFYVDYNNSASSFEDMRLMSFCKHNIIANSSFSWWGAWLNQNTNKIVIAPKIWFNDEKKNSETKDLIPDGWIRL